MEKSISTAGNEGFLVDVTTIGLGAFGVGMAPTNEKQFRPARWRRWLIRGGLSILVFLNVIAILEARGMCRYERQTARTTRLSQIDAWGRARILLCGPVVRRQSNTRTPADLGLRFTTRRFAGAQGLGLEAWSVPGDATRPVIVMFPGYGASKDTLLRAAVEFHSLGHEIFLVDFHGAGGSDGATTTIGFDEAEDVAAAANQLTGRKYVLYGTSMGAVATLRAVYLGKVQPEQLILEAPFDTFLNTVSHRFDVMRVPRFPLAHMLVFWGGAMNGFNGYAHNPIEYSRSVRCPTLLMQGAQDEMVGADVPRQFQAVLGERGKVVIIAEARHAFLFQSQPEVWRRHVREFLAQR